MRLHLTTVADKVIIAAVICFTICIIVELYAVEVPHVSSTLRDSMTVYNKRTKVLLTATDQELIVLQVEGTKPVAISAAWESTRRELASAVKPSDRALAAGRFAGFLSGRLHTEVPKWWEGLIAKAVIDQTGACNLINGKDIAREAALISRENTSWRINNTKMFVLHNATEIEVDVTKSLVSDRVTVACWSGAGIGLVAVYDDLPMPYELHAYGLNKKEFWRTRIWAGGFAGVSGIASFHHVEIRERNGITFVFGAAESAAYLETFRSRDGKALLRFATSY